MQQHPASLSAYLALLVGFMLLGAGGVLSYGAWNDPREYDPGAGLLTAGGIMVGLSVVALAVATRRNALD